MYNFSKNKNFESFDADILLQLLSMSFSLSIDEKVRVIESLPTLSLYQLNKLKKLYTKEKKKFNELRLDGNEQEIMKLFIKTHFQWLVVNTKFLDFDLLQGIEERITSIRNLTNSLEIDKAYEYAYDALNGVFDMPENVLDALIENGNLNRDN